MGQVKISNEYVDNISWIPGPACEFELAKAVDVWKINVPSAISFADDFIKILSLTEITRASRYVRPADRNRSVISRGALRIILGGYLNERPQALTIAEDVNKKPFLPDETGLFFNVSHSGDWILIAVAGSAIGVDIEFIKPEFKFQDILTDYFDEEEIKFINEGASAGRFFTLWTRKEALAKAIGTGLGSPLKYFPALDGNHFSQSEIVSFDEDYSINSFKINEAYIASVAASPSINDIRFWDMDFNGFKF